MTFFNDFEFDQTTTNDTPIALYTRDDIERLACGDPHRTISTAALESTLHYLKGFISSPHPYLGREGDVCPFTRKALEMNSMRYAVYEGEHSIPAMSAAMVNMLQAFNATEPKEGSQKLLKAFIMIFPHVTENDFVTLECTQKLLKNVFVSHGLMIGEFHSESNAEGIRNPDFRPLRSPYPLLAIRHMTTSDLVFLDGSPSHFRGYKQSIGSQKIPIELISRYEKACSRFGYPDSISPLHPKIFELLHRADTYYEVIAHQSFSHSIKSPAEFAKAANISVDSIAKSIVCELATPGNFCIAVVPAQRRINRAALAEVIGSDVIRITSPETASRLTGHELHGVSPLGVDGCSIIIDRALAEHREIFVGTGYAGAELKINTDTLVALSAALVRDISE